MRQIRSIAFGNLQINAANRRRGQRRLFDMVKSPAFKRAIRQLKYIFPLVILIPITFSASAEEMQFSDPDYSKPVKSLWEIRSNKVVMQKWDMSCGAAALTTIMNYQYDDHIDEQVVAMTMLKNGNLEKIKKQHGFSLLDLKKYSEMRGYKATGYKNLNIEELAELKFAIVPVIEFGKNPHFIVVREIRSDNTLDVADPAFGNRTVPIEEFKQVWEGNVAFILERKE